MKQALDMQYKSEKVPLQDVVNQRDAAQKELKHIKDKLHKDKIVWKAM